MKRLSKLVVYLNVVNEKIKRGCFYQDYHMKLNSYLKSVVVKLNEQNLIANLIIKGNVCSFYPLNITKLKTIFPSVNFKIKDLMIVKKQYTENDTCKGLLISTNKGIYTLEDCQKQGIGGELIAVYTHNITK